MILTTIKRKINMAAAYKEITQAELARSIGMSPSNFNGKAKRGTFTVDELNAIAGTLGASYEFGFKFPDGTSI